MATTMLREPFAENIAEPLPVMLWRAKPDLSCEYVSRQWLEYTGCTEDQALGEGWSRYLHPEDLARWLDMLVRALDVREPFEIEYRLRRRDGVYRWVLDRGLPRYARDGLFLGFVGTLLDMDERKRAEQELAQALERERRLRAAAEEASRRKDGFLATVLLNLRAPVQAIAAWAASGEAGALDAIEHNARAQERIIASLLELAGTSPVAKASLNGVRVLIVEDDPGERDAIARVLGVAGAETKAAGSADEALQAIERFRPDVMLSDPAMRGAEGSRLIRAARARSAERGACLRAAALTPAEESGRAMAADYDAQLAKPVEPVALLATVARLAA
jgi:PAS domain S-box-containing protein